MKKRVCQFFILLCQFICGGLVTSVEFNFIIELVVIILPFSIVGAILFVLYDQEIKEELLKIL